MRKPWWERERARGLGVTIQVSGADEAATTALLARLAQPVDPKQEILVPIIVYPLNGRADCVSPIAHYYWAQDRERAIADVLEEVMHNEGREDVARFAALLTEHDTVRIGRIVVHMFRMKQQIPTHGVGVLSPPLFHVKQES